MAIFIGYLPNPEKTVSVSKPSRPLIRQESVDFLHKIACLLGSSLNTAAAVISLINHDALYRMLLLRHNADPLNSCLGILAVAVLLGSFTHIPDNV